MRPVVRGAISGAAGTAALNAVTYMDMLVRGRPPSDVPAEVAGALVRRMHVPIGRGEASVNRLEGLGALFGYAVGIGIGAIRGALGGRRGRVAWPITAVALGAAAMLSSDVPAVVTGASKPRTWGTAGWLADIVPHLTYGLVAATVFELLVPRRQLRAAGLLKRLLRP